jgi:hypothetical protein
MSDDTPQGSSTQSRTQRAQQQQQQQQASLLQQQHSQPLSPKQQQQQQQHPQLQQQCSQRQDIGKHASWHHIDGLLRILSGMGCSDTIIGNSSGDTDIACGSGLKALLSSLTDDIYVTSE